MQGKPRSKTEGATTTNIISAEKFRLGGTQPNLLRGKRGAFDSVGSASRRSARTSCIPKHGSRQINSLRFRTPTPQRSVYSCGPAATRETAACCRAPGRRYSPAPSPPPPSRLCPAPGAACPPAASCETRPPYPRSRCSSLFPDTIAEEQCDGKKKGVGRGMKVKATSVEAQRQVSYVRNHAGCPSAAVGKTCSKY